VTSPLFRGGSPRSLYKLRLGNAATAPGFDPDGTLGFLLSRIDHERTSAVPYDRVDFKLDRMRELLSRLGDPQRGLNIVHVAGTKGKGSTAAMVAAMLAAAGYRTGLYSSPHLDRVEERVSIDGQNCSPTEFRNLLCRMRHVVEQIDRRSEREFGGGPTYFEIITALALLHFAERRVDAAVLEVGLGGRLDSTNVCSPLVCVIISFDHTRQLGSTLTAIATEKAGIIKPGIPVVSGVMAAEPTEVIRSVAKNEGCNLMELARDFGYTYRAPHHLEKGFGHGQLDYWSRGTDQPQSLDGAALNLLGRHQAANAAVALATVGELRRQGWTMDDAALRKGLVEVRWPARIEVLKRRPTIVLDAAHNLASVAAFVQVLEESFSARRRLLVFATTQDKDVRGMLAMLLPKFDDCILTRYSNNPRGVPTAELETLSHEIGGGTLQVCTDPRSAWQAVRRLAGEEDLIGITGSFFIAAEMRAAIANNPLG